MLQPLESDEKLLFYMHNNQIVVHSLKFVKYLNIRLNLYFLTNIFCGFINFCGFAAYIHFRVWLDKLLPYRKQVHTNCRKCPGRYGRDEGGSGGSGFVSPLAFNRI